MNSDASILSVTTLAFSFITGANYFIIEWATHDETDVFILKTYSCVKDSNCKKRRKKPFKLLVVAAVILDSLGKAQEFYINLKKN